MSVEGERELEEFLAGALSGRPVAEEPEQPEEKPEVVYDEPPDRQMPPDEGVPTPPVSPPAEGEEAPAEEEEEEQPEGEVDQYTAWATKLYGKDQTGWAKVLYDKEQYISRLTDEKKQAEDVAREAIEYAQQVESAGQMAMPLSASEEAWIENSMMNPAAAAYQAARAGNGQLYNAVLERVAMENPAMVAQITAQVQQALNAEAEAVSARNGSSQPSGDFTTDLAQSFQRVGVDVNRYGQAMWEKFEELGQHHRYTLAALGGDQLQRDIAVQAVYDLVRQGETTTRRVADTEREERIRREGELRREAASVVTGSPHVQKTEESPFMQAMENEWKRRGQWTDEE